MAAMADAGQLGFFLWFCCQTWHLKTMAVVSTVRFFCAKVGWGGMGRVCRQQPSSPTTGAKISTTFSEILSKTRISIQFNRAQQIEDEDSDSELKGPICKIMTWKKKWANSLPSQLQECMSTRNLGQSNFPRPGKLHREFQMRPWHQHGCRRGPVFVVNVRGVLVARNLGSLLFKRSRTQNSFDCYCKISPRLSFTSSQSLKHRHRAIGANSKEFPTSDWNLIMSWNLTCV